MNHRRYRDPSSQLISFKFSVIGVDIFIFGSWLGIGSDPCHPFREPVRQLFLLIKSYVPPADRSSHRLCSIKRVFLKISQNSQGNSCARVFLIKSQALGLKLICNFIKNDTLEQVPYFEFGEIFKKIFFRDYHWTIASDLRKFRSAGDEQL